MTNILARRAATSVALLLAGAAPIVAAESFQPTRKPNIVYILMDDLGYGELGAFYQNSRPADKPRIKTPALDRMAAEGMMLTHHYCAAPLCAPSRASFLTGLNQGHCDLRDNQFDKPLLEDHTLGTVLKQAGYYTATIGKWGVGGTAPPWPAHPLNRGFDEFYGYMLHVAAHDHYPKPGEIFDGVNPVGDELAGIYSADLFTARAKAFLVDRAQHHKDQPFMLYLAYVDPHGPLEIPPGPYPAGKGLKGGMQMPLKAYGTPNSYLHPDVVNETWNAPEKRFATMMRRTDDCVDDVLQTLKDLGIDKDTLVVFTSDNGAHDIDGHDPAFFDSWGIYDGYKRDLFEGGAREPTIAWWPGTIKPGSTSAELSAQYDWLSTFAQLAGLVAPASRDGISLAPTLLGHPGAQMHHPYLYSEYKGALGPGPYSRDFVARKHYKSRGQEQSVRIGQFAGVRYAVANPDDPLRLYDLAADPKENHDLSEDPAHRPMLERMKTMLVTERTPNADAPRPYDAVPLPAVPEPANAGSLTLHTYAGSWPWVPDFRTLTPAGTQSVKALTLPTSFDAKPAFGAEWTGFIKAPTTGVYKFKVQSDGGADLWLHGSLVIHDDFAPKVQPLMASP